MFRKYLSIRWVTGVEKQTLGISFQTIPQKRTQLGIPFRATKNRNNLSEYRSEEKPTYNKTRQQNVSKIVSEKTTFDVQTNHFVKLFCCCLVKLIFSAEFHSVLSFGIGSSAELGMPRNECFFRGITETVPSLFRGIFPERNSVPNPSWASAFWHS